MKKVIKRALAYLIDIIIIILLIGLINFIVPKSENELNIQSKINKLNEQSLKENINFSTYLEEYSHLIYELDKNNIVEYLVILVIIHIYFIVIPYLTCGKTVGMYKIKVVENDGNLSLISLWIRNFIWNGNFYFIGLLLCLMIFKDKIYFISTIILGIIQILLVNISQFMIIYRKDCRGLHDILSNTKIKEEV